MYNENPSEIGAVALIYPFRIGAATPIYEIENPFGIGPATLLDEIEYPFEVEAAAPMRTVGFPLL